METKSKAETFVGFAVKARKVKMGFNAIETSKKANLIIVCKSASDNTKEKAKSLAKHFHTKLFETKEKNLEEIVYKPNIKIIAITDFGLAKAIIENKEKDFSEVE